MPRRTATMLASTLILIALFCAGLLIKVPYSEMSPGPTVNTLGEARGEPVLRITGRKTYPTSGHLNMTTVRVTGADYRMNLGEAVWGWLAHDSVVVPHDTLYPDGKTEEQSTQENAEEFSQSQESAKVAALKELDIPVATQVVVSTVVKGSPSEGKLHAGDVIKAVDGTAVKEPGDVAELVTKHKPGEDVTFTIVPADEAAAAEKAGRVPEGGRKITLTTEKAPATEQGGEEEDRAIVGIRAGTDHTFPFEIDIELGGRRRSQRRADVLPGHHRQAHPVQSDRRKVRRGHRNHRRRGQGRPDRRDQHEAGRGPRGGRPLLPHARRQLRRGRVGHPGRADPGPGQDPR